MIEAKMAEIARNVANNFNAISPFSKTLVKRTDKNNIERDFKDGD